MAMDPARMARLAKQGATLAVKYGPQAKLAWDKGGHQAANAAAARVALLRARRRAFTEAEGVKDGAVLRVAPGGDVTYVVLSGVTPVAAHPPREGVALPDLLRHADLDRRTTPEQEHERRAARRRRLSRRGARPGPADPPGLPPRAP
ncbi:hypothetical protein [Nocardioides lentus]|uniref:hypothetical protein n=1 Tax=Nocardioides lentus TaxID=338077 RepID=UPI0031DE89A6